jgi:hypothetical protein
MTAIAAVIKMQNDLPQPNKKKQKELVKVASPIVHEETNVFERIQKAMQNMEEPEKKKPCLSEEESILMEPEPKPQPQHDQNFLFHWLPKAAIEPILQNLDQVLDICALFRVVSPQYRHSLERVFCMQLAVGMENMGFEGAHFIRTTCFQREQFCRLPSICLRCRLYGNGKCIRCKTQVQMNYKETCNPCVCQTVLVEKNDSGRTSVCAEMIACKHCGESYHPITYEEKKRMRDWDCTCCKSPVREGCVKCTRECDQCANIGCLRKQHFQVLTEDFRHVDSEELKGGSFTRNPTWPRCSSEWCQGNRHCCAKPANLAVWLDRDCPGDGWEYFSCPGSGGAGEICPIVEEVQSHLQQQSPQRTQQEIKNRRFLRAPRRTKAEEIQEKE